MIPFQIYAYYHYYHCHFHSITVVGSILSHELDLHDMELIPKHSQAMNEIRRGKEKNKKRATEGRIDQSDQAAGG